MTRVERSIARCDGIIADLLEYTRAREVNRVPTPLDAWLGEVLDELQIPEGIAVERRFGASEGFVELDVNRFRRVVINLVDNALQAVAENKAPDAMRRIAVTTRLAERAEITIEDSGPGIPPEVLPRVFEPLFSTKSFGTGLGLPTVKQIVEQHGGTIAIASRMGSGTAVHVSLPSGAAAKEAA
jgi:signal transduction histidine kinase